MILCPKNYKPYAGDSLDAVTLTLKFSNVKKLLKCINIYVSWQAGRRYDACDADDVGKLILFQLLTRKPFWNVNIWYTLDPNNTLLLLKIW